MLRVPTSGTLSVVMRVDGDESKVFMHVGVKRTAIGMLIALDRLEVIVEISGFKASFGSTSQ